MQYEIPLSRGGILRLGPRTLLMGVLNVTPDSFYDGGEFIDVDQAVDHGIRLAKEGADIIDVGGESTRPDAEPVDMETELRRVLPVVEKLSRQVSIPISIDTYKSEVAEKALARGAQIINDVSGFRFDTRLPEVARKTEAVIVLMHMRGTPATMHRLPPSSDILGEVKRDLSSAITTAKEQGIGREKVIVDPGIGFGKNTQENLLILNNLHVIKELNLPVLVGTSRKSFIGKILELPTSERLVGTAATVAVAVMRGAHVVRVHDVKPMKEVIDIVDAIRNTPLYEAAAGSRA